LRQTNESACFRISSDWCESGVKKSLEAYWSDLIEQSALEQTGRELRQRHWQAQQQAGLDFVTVGDFAFYDHVLNHSLRFGVIPHRFGTEQTADNLDLSFRLARGRAPTGVDAAACEMTKWFDSNYHYIVPELHAEQQFSLSDERLFNEVKEAQALGHDDQSRVDWPINVFMAK